jgi:hypothetical protein
VHLVTNLITPTTAHGKYTYSVLKSPTYVSTKICHNQGVHSKGVHVNGCKAEYKIYPAILMCCNVTTLEYSALVGQILYLANHNARYEQYKGSEVLVHLCYAPPDDDNGLSKHT